MSDKKLFTVFGATGNQGSSVITHILNNPKLSQEYKLRGVTRNTSSDKAKALKEKGVEMVVGDMEDYSSVSKVIEGSYGVFAVTNYWEMPSKEREVNQGKRVADACKEHGVKQLVWSNLPHVGKLSNGKFPNVLHFDGKAEIGEYIAEIGLPHVNVVPAMFMSNIKSSIQKNGETGDYTFALPLASTVKLPFINAGKDMGNFVAGALLKPEIFDASSPVSISAAAGYWTGDEVVEMIKQKTGKNAGYYQLPDETFKGFMSTPELGQEMLENFWLVRDYGYFGPTIEGAIKDWEESLKYAPVPPQRLKEYIDELDF